MKKAFISFVVALLLVPTVSYGATLEELERQHIQLLEQLVALLTARLEQLVAAQGVISSPSSLPTVGALVTEVPKKRSGGGGGGGGGSSSPSLVLNMTGSGNEFHVSANKRLSPTAIGVTLLDFPSDLALPLALTLRAEISNSTYLDIELVKESSASTYSADMRARLSGDLRFTGKFEVVFPEPTHTEHIAYSVLYSGNGITRTINLVNEGETPLGRAELKSSLNNPVSSTLKVEDDNSDSDEFEILVFDIDVAEDSSVLTLNNAVVQVEIANPNGSSTTASDVISDVWLQVGGQKVTGTAGVGYADEVANGDTVSVPFTFDFSDATLTPSYVYEAVVSIVFNGQDDSVGYKDGVTVRASVDSSDSWGISSFHNNYGLSGSVAGATHTLSASTAVVDNMKWTVGSSFIDFTFTVEAEDEDFDVLLADIIYSVEGTATTSEGVLARISGDSVDTIEGGFKVVEGDRTTFRVRYTVSGNNGDWSEVTITSVAERAVDEDIQISPTLTLNINS